MNDQRYSGKMFMLNGAIYEGKFKNDEFYGKGVITYADGTVLTAIFENSNIPRLSKIYFPDFQETFIGYHNDFSKEGLGKLIE